MSSHADTMTGDALKISAAGSRFAHARKIVQLTDWLPRHDGEIPSLHGVSVWVNLVDISEVQLADA